MSDSLCAVPRRCRLSLPAARSGSLMPHGAFIVSMCPVFAVIAAVVALLLHCRYGGGGGFFLACEDFGRMFDSSFPACAFLFFFF